MNDCNISDLFKTITKWVDDNGGSKVLADIIMSENHEVFTHEAVKADQRLRDMGIFSYDDIEPLPKVKCSEYIYNAIEQMYPTHSYPQMAEILDKPTSYIRSVTFVLIRRNKIKPRITIHPAWTKEEDNYIKEHGRKIGSRKLAKELKRTVFAVNTRKYVLRVRMDEEFKQVKGRH